MRIRRVLASLYVQVLIGIAAGILLGFVAPRAGAAMRPLGDGFIKLVKMLIAPIVFSTVVVGIAHMGAMREVGRIGLRALHLLRGGVDAGAVHRPGGRQRAAARARPRRSTRRSLDMSAVASYTTRVEDAAHGRLPPQHHSDDGRRRVRARRDPAGAARLGAVRPRAAVARQARRAARRRRSIRSARRCSASSASSCGWRRSARSARWRSRSAATASARWSRSAS